ncbi:hypothetical protein AB0E59_32010 [Lentzea sp. NPDC034063]|uniref:hypothetical protein n=1 Tax=unclassified Lentzea TaxID=2643253 RepID=UPI00340E0BDB
MAAMIVDALRLTAGAATGLAAFWALSGGGVLALTLFVLCVACLATAPRRTPGGLVADRLLRLAAAGFVGVVFVPAFLPLLLIVRSRPEPPLSPAGADASRAVRRIVRAATEPEVADPGLTAFLLHRHETLSGVIAADGAVQMRTVLLRRLLQHGPQALTLLAVAVLCRFGTPLPEAGVVALVLTAVTAPRSQA